MTSNELKKAIELALQAGRATPEERRRILSALQDDDFRPAEKYLRTKEAAALLGACGKTVFRYEAKGLLHGIRRSARCVRWRKSEVEKLAAHGAGAV